MAEHGAVKAFKFFIWSGGTQTSEVRGNKFERSTTKRSLVSSIVGSISDDLDYPQFLQVLSHSIQAKIFPFEASR
jgi:hypothetical protein